MGQGINRVILFGDLGSDPELRCTQGGTSVLSIRMATTESYLDKDKERKERTEWHSVIVWGARADGLSRILHKGSRVLIEGSLRTSSYDDRDGNKRYKVEIVASNVVLADRAPSNGGASHASEEAPSPGRSATRPANTQGGETAGDFEVKFGRDKGKRISEVKDLTSLRGTLVKDLDDPAKAQYRATTAKKIASIDAEVGRRAGGTSYRDTTGARGGDAHESTTDEVGGGGSNDWSDDDVPF